MKKFFPLLLLLLGFSGKVRAEEVNALTLWMASGDKVVFLLDERPLVMFKGDEVLLSTPMKAVSYSAADVLKFTYSYVDPAGIARPGAAEAFFSFDGDRIRAFRLGPQSAVEVYSADGRLLSKAVTDGSGNVSIPVPAQPGGICIIKTSVATFKIVKP